jgi:glyoxylase-like metal-dependent hydrolase (beta-lactamase superfamily II)
MLPVTENPRGSVGWDALAVEKVAADVHRIPLPLPSDALKAVNVYAIESPDELVLIDGGWALEASRLRLEHALRELGRSLGDIGRFLVTHVHRDHYTQAIAIRRDFGARVALGVGERRGLESLHTPGRSGLDLQVAQLRQCGAGPVMRQLLAHVRQSPLDLGNWELPDEWLRGDDRFRLGDRELLAVSTPGHTQGHLVFADLEEGLLFAGDHVLPHITPSIGFESAPSPLPLGSYLQSLAVVRQMPDLVLLPAHGSAGASVHARVDELLAHHEARLDVSHAVVVAGASTAFEAAQRLEWTRRARRFVDLDWFNQMLATIETGAHLDLLAARGRLSRAVVEGVVRYAPA